MKKTVLSTMSMILAGWAIHINAQTLNQTTHAPAVGDVYSFQYADPSSLPANLGNPGSGNTFNFNGLVIYPGTSTSTGTTVVSTGSASAYPNANVAVSTGTDNTFYNAQSNQLEYYGGNLTIGGYPIIITYTTPAVYGIYPMSLGTSNSGTVAGSIYAMSNNGNFTGTSSFTANATGTLTLPGGISYANVMRVQTQQNMTFTISFVQGTITVNQYDYYAPNYSNFPNPNNNWPLLTVQQSTLTTTIGGTSVQTTVTINSNYQTLSNEHSSMVVLPSELHISPNPAKDYFKVHSTQPIKSIKIFDITGKSIKANLTPSMILNCSDLHNGIYFVQFEEENGNIVTKKLIINR